MEKFNKVILLITEGKALRNALREVKMSSETFYKIINNDKNAALQYARATEERSEILVEDMLSIADAYEDDVHLDEDGNEVTNHNIIQRDRLRVDTRKWLASKLKPKKYGDSSKLELEVGDKTMNALFSADILNVPTDNSTQEDTEA